MSKAHVRGTLATLSLVTVVGTALLSGTHDQPEPPVNQDSGASVPVTIESFCLEYSTLTRAQDAHLSAPTAENVRAMKSAAGTLASMGVVPTLPSDGQVGLALALGRFQRLDESATGQDLMEAGTSESILQDRQLDALGVWIGTNCGNGSPNPPRAIAPSVLE